MNAEPFIPLSPLSGDLFILNQDIQDGDSRTVAFSQEEQYIIEKTLNGSPFLREAQQRKAPFFLVKSCSSVLDIARYLINKENFPIFSCILTEEQTSGRGQWRRKWISPRGNLYVAMRIPNTPPFIGNCASAAVGAFMANALDELGFPVLLKWPNDLILMNPQKNEFQKIGGILLEEYQGALIAGIGININSSPSEDLLREEHIFPAGHISLLPRQEKTEWSGSNIVPNLVNIFTVWAKLALRFFSCYEKNLQRENWWVQEFNKRLLYLGQDITLIDAVPEDNSKIRDSVFGRIDGVTESGAIRLITDEGSSSFIGGSLASVH